VYRPKKAAQYGSGIHKLLIKKVLKKKDYSKYLDEKYKIFWNNKVRGYLLMNIFL